APSKITPDRHEAPGRPMPSKIIVPRQPGPSSGPHAWVAIGPAEGGSVMPGSKVTMPVGLSGVPPQVHNLRAGGESAFAAVTAAKHIASAAPAAAAFKRAR